MEDMTVKYNTDSSWMENSTNADLPDYTTVPVHQNPAADFWELHVARFLYACPSIICLLVGSVGNILSFIVFNSTTMRQTVTSMYFRVLAISDTVVLFSGSLVFFILGAFDLDIRLDSTFSCKFWLPLLVVACYHSCWILVFIASDRFIGVYVPHKYKKICSQRRAIIGMVVLFLVVSLTVGTFWIMALEITPDGKTCGIAAEYLDFFTGVFRWLDLTMLNLVPSIILVSLNICIIVKITRARMIRTTSMGGTAKSTKTVSSPTTILLSVSLVYILCTIPSSTAFLVTKTFSDTPHGAAQGLLYTRSCETLYLANHAVNFFLYCIHGTSFRKELKRIFNKMKLKPGSTTLGTDSTALSSVRRPKYTKHDVN